MHDEDPADEALDSRTLSDLDLARVLHCDCRVDLLKDDFRGERASLPNSESKSGAGWQ